MFIPCLENFLNDNGLSDELLVGEPYQLDGAVVELGPNFIDFGSGSILKNSSSLYQNTTLLSGDSVDPSNCSSVGRRQEASDKKRKRFDDASRLTLTENADIEHRSNEITEYENEDKLATNQLPKVATTSRHSLAERIRRERISERMKVLEDLVPGCDKITGKAIMLDELINYVLSLQHQAEDKLCGSLLT
ncbi:unnamed protein product [Fraxinus pennsylvanica]|uniref:BHLH domain-containing protein n=1 Tax=Fraxinus pennsylvanica TaxID=56036 RepID=A0AAD1YMF0_9LAMI|nr:unnamed protein product [Fraxinus pennsylvanica]